ncbi:MAG: hypothetical protein EB084_08440 [Proteobacteria bacterium]|nr:hypothetical protein [Pseudomonadota bacterium]
MNLPELFTLLVERRATHMHIVPGSPILLRNGSQLTPVSDQLVSPADTAALLESFLSEEQRYYFFENKDLSITQSIPGLSRFRVNALQQRGSVAFIISTHPPAPPTLEELGFPDNIKSLLGSIKGGLIVLCGTRYSGKSSTLAALVSYLLETRAVQIVSFENPIDYLHKNRKGTIIQREIGTDVLNYEAALETLSYQQADVVVTTEMETYEQISAAVSLALGGTLCIAVMKVPSVMLACESLMNVYPAHLSQHARNIVAAATECIISHTLLRKSNGPGVVPAFEVLAGISPVKAMLREGKTGLLSGVMSQAGRDFGMQTQEQALRVLVKKNAISQEEALSKSFRPDEFRKMLSAQM